MLLTHVFPIYSDRAEDLVFGIEARNSHHPGDAG